MSEQMNDMHADGQQADWQRGIEEDMLRNLAMPLMQLVRGEGSSVWDSEGNRYLDFLSGIAVLSLGHAHPVFVEAVSSQAATLAHVSNYFSTPPQIALARTIKRLAETGPEGRVYFCNSGTEANEAAFKLARLHGGGTRSRILTLNRSFHGRTMGALALTGQPALHEPFAPMVPGVEHIDATIEALEASIDETVAALFVEPIQGEAGVLPLPQGFLQAARELTERHGALLIIDEIQTGAGRTGAWFGFQHSGITPDAITLAKGLGGGFPIGALVTYGRASELFSPGSHGSTFGGNPLATHVAGAVLGEIERAGLVQNAAERGVQMREAIEAIGSPLVENVRGAGLLLGVALTAPVAKQVLAAAQAHGLIVNAPGENILRIAPALTIGDAEIAEFAQKLAAALADVQRAHAAEAAPAAATEETA
ncbi:MAG: acetylornithine transaminase [Microbacteriaceae bacterium]|jgi:acetylornithine aminotransferase|nr:acetylornithine transaminase [Microbacteriaceae bacterium]HQC93222.1 acetylornithine transaminase [Microbacteriaceae bacterium]